jgi:hypothetical protein
MNTHLCWTIKDFIFGYQCFVFLMFNAEVSNKQWAQARSSKNQPETHMSDVCCFVYVSLFNVLCLSIDPINAQSTMGFISLLNVSFLL